VAEVKITRAPAPEGITVGSAEGTLPWVDPQWDTGAFAAEATVEIVERA
jgi:hypothetical protein